MRFPAGLDINAQNPQEIAVALLAELIAFKNSGKADMYLSPKLDEELKGNDEHLLNSDKESSQDTCCSSKKGKN